MQNGLESTDSSMEPAQKAGPGVSGAGVVVPGRRRGRPPKADFAAFITESELADLMGVSQPAISKLVKEGKIGVSDQEGRLFRHQTLKTSFQYLRNRIGETTEGLGAKKTAALALDIKLKELELAKAEGKLIAIDEIESTWANIVLLTRQKLLRIANKVSPRLVFCKTEHEIEKEIQTEVEEALRELSRQKGSPQEMLPLHD